MDAIDAIKNIHDIGELNVFISIVSVVALIVLVITGIQKFMDVLGIETKGSLRRKAQEKRIAELENKIMLLNKELDTREDHLYNKQKSYHEQSIRIRDALKQNQEQLSKDVKEIKSLIINNTIESMRWEILDFSNAIMSGREYNKEQYDHVLDTHEKYEKILEENGMTNGQTSASFDFIKKHYDKLMETGFRDAK